MVVKISKKMKISVSVLLGFVIVGAVCAYQKLFGGKAQNLKQNHFIVGRENGTPTIPEPVEKEEERIVSVYYSDNIAQGVDEVVQRTGNMDFITPGDKVLVKPNVNSDDPAPATTHPEAVAEVVRLAKAKGAYIIVGDRSNPNWKTISAMKKTGIYDAVKNAGADEIVGFEDEEWVRVTPENSKNWKNGFRVPKRLAEVDHLISVPVLHTHSITGHSLAIKNIVGLIDPADRMLFHASKNRDAMIAEISLAIKPDLTVIDGTKAFIRGGPSAGTLADTKVYLSSKDTLTADVVGVALLTKHGANFTWSNPWESGLIKSFVSLNLSGYSRERIGKEIDNI